MPWNDVEFDFGGDETCNFGPRKESGSLLYQVNTLATISSSEQAAQLPVVSSSLSTKGVCVAADQQVSIFDENCQRLLVILSFESVVDLIKWSDDATFLIIAERNGNIHFAHSGMGKILYSQTLAENTNGKQVFFQGAELCPYPEEDIWNFLVLTSTTLFRFPKISFTEIQSAIKIGNVEVIQKMMVYDTIDVSSVINVPRSLASYTQPDGAYAVTTGSGTNLLAVWKLKSDVTELYQCIPSRYLQGDSFQKCLVFDDYIFVLDDKNVLVAFDKRYLIQLARWSAMEINDFILINYNPVLSSSNLEGDDTSVQVVAVTSIDGESFLKVISLPGMECVYSLAVKPYSFLADMPPYFETIYMIEGTSKYGDEDVDNREVSTLRVRCLTEALPETRFHRLLHLSKFGEAEEFAKLFGLDLQMVHKTKANYLMKQMTLEETEVSENLSIQMKELRECLDNVTDERFIASICSDVGLPSLSANQILLSYVYNRVCNSQDLNVTDLKIQLLAKMKELKTFELVHGEHCFSQDKWHSFLQPTVVEELMKILKASMLAPAMALCLRHKEEILGQMDLKLFKLILDSIPTDVCPASIIPWLRDVLFPLVFRDYPAGKKLLADWVGDRVRNMEIRDKNSWPGNGIDLLQIFFSAYQTHTRIGQVCATEDSQILDSLETLLGQLMGLRNIKDTYQCSLSLQDYTQETVTSIAFVMLNRVAAIELVPRVVENQVKPYAEHNHLDLDKLLSEYIMYHCNSLQSRAISISQYIADSKLFCQSVLCLMKRSQVPWSSGLEDLVQTCLKLDDPLADQMQDNYKLIKLCRMLGQYKLENIDLRNTDIVQMAIYNILQRDQDSVMMNALQLVEAHQQITPLVAYIIRMTFLLRQKKLDDCFVLFCDLEKDVAVECAEIMVKYGKIYLSEPITWSLSEEEKAERLIFCQATIKFIGMLLKQPDVTLSKSCEWMSELQEIQSLRNLLSEFDVFHYFNEESCNEEKLAELAEFCHTLPGKKIETSSTNFKVNESTWNKSQTSLMSGMNNSLQDNTVGMSDPSKKLSVATRFGKCLHLREEEVKSLLITEALKKKNIKEVINICRDLCYPDCSEEGARVVFDALLSICEVGGHCTPHQITSLVSALGNTADLFHTLYELCCTALTSASNDNICDLAELSKHLRLLQDIERQCETGDYGSAVEISDSETGRFSSSDWLIDEFFCEDSMVMESSEALPRAATFIKSCMPTNNIEGIPYRLCRLLGQPVPHFADPTEGSSPPVYYLPRLQTTGDQLIEYLTGNNHHQVTLMVAVEVMMSGIGYIDGNIIAATLVHPKMKDGIVEEMKTMKSILGKDFAVAERCASLLLDKIFEAENVNQSLALSFLLLLRKPSASKKLKQLCASSGYNYKKIMAISEVGQEFASFCLKDESVKAEYEQLKKLASWGQKLRKHKISFKDAFQRPAVEELEKVLPMITCNHQIELTLILEFCRDFNLSGDGAMLMYLKQCLLPNSGQHKQRTDLTFYLDVCKLEEASRKIQDKRLLVTNLNDTLEEVDSYDYERIGFILKMLKNYSGTEGSDSINKQLELLGHLQVYKRISSRSVAEVSQQTSDDYKVTAEYKDRLPFHALLKSLRWKILSKELTDKTIDQLLPVIHLLQLPSDQVYVTTIHNILHETKDNSINPSQKLERGKSSVYLKMLDSVQNLLLQVENLQMAVATARLVAKDIPKGPEKVVAFKMCNLLAEKWVQTSEENSPEKEKASVTLKYLSEKYRFLATERALYKYNLAEEKHLQQVNSPNELIFTLYQHQSIVSRKKGEITTVPDIHAAAETISKINDCNLENIHKTLLGRWLCKPLTHQEEDEDVTINYSTLNGQSKEEESEENIYLMRIRYLLELEEPGKTVEVLLKMADDESTSFSTRLRTLKCLLDISDSEMLQKISGQTLQQLWEHLQNVSYLSELEELNFNLDLKTFLQANKQGLVRGMLRKHSQEPKALKLIADLCLKYNVMDFNLWNCLVQQMVKFKMFSDLEQVLHSISGIGELQQIPCVGPAWCSMLLQPFKTARVPLSDEERTACRRSLILLHSCPVTCDLDVLKLKDCFCQVEMLPEALACLFHLPITEKSEKIKTFLETVDFLVLSDQLRALKASNHLLPEAHRIEEVLREPVNGVS